MIHAQLRIASGGRRRNVALADYLFPDGEEQAHRDEYAWIKGLRHAPVGGDPLRDRFTVRGDSLWWFTELYLHKTQVVLEIHRVLTALTSLVERERPTELGVVSGSTVVTHVAPLFARARGIAASAGAPGAARWWRRLARLDLQARTLTWRAHVSAERRRPVRGRSGAAAEIAAFVHRAFWRGSADEGAAESYIGPVLQELEERRGADALRYVGVGPSTNFRTPRAAAAAPPSGLVTPIERFAPMARLRDSRAVWRARYRDFRTLTRSRALRDVAVIGGVDCWPLVREQLAGVAWLQWPWSARAMDEAAAALDALSPSVVLTYAEAGGWGRALILEARRRAIPSAGLQHGFIYRHWLNYRHEPDEVIDARTPRFPAPSRTLLFDEYAATHLRTHGRFDPASLQVTGSPRLDVLIRTIAALDEAAVAAARREAGLVEQEVFVLVTTKEREARPFLPSLVHAASVLPQTVLVIKPHPAETAAVYLPYAAAHVRILSPSAPLAPLLRAARAVVTVNSTVALDAAAVDIPALSIGLPNNLSPFVEAGAIAGAKGPAELPALLQQILYDEGFREQLKARRTQILGPSAAASDGQAAARAARAVLDLARRTPQRHGEKEP